MSTFTSRDLIRLLALRASLRDMADDPRARIPTALVAEMFDLDLRREDAIQDLAMSMAQNATPDNQVIYAKNTRETAGDGVSGTIYETLVINVPPADSVWRWPALQGIARKLLLDDWMAGKPGLPPESFGTFMVKRAMKPNNGLNPDILDPLSLAARTGKKDR